MRITYIGPLPGVTLPDGQRVARNTTATVTKTLGDQLLHQPDNWRRATRTPSDPPPTTATATTEES